MFGLKDINLKRVSAKQLVTLYLQYALLAGSAKKKQRECEQEFKRRDMPKPKNKPTDIEG